MNRCSTPGCNADANHADEGKSYCLDCICARLGVVARKTLARLKEQHGMTGGKYPVGPRCYEGEPVLKPSAETKAPALPKSARQKGVAFERRFVDPDGSRRAMTPEKFQQYSDAGKKGAAARLETLRRRREEFRQ